VKVAFSTINGGWPGESNLALYPIFVDPTNDSFKLKNSSPCIGTGKLEGSPDKDISGAPRPDPSDSKPDIGAYENSLASPEIPALEDVLDIFGIELGNRWKYEGIYQGKPYAIEREFIALNRSSFSVPTYVNQIRQDGIIIGKEWYEKTEDQIKLWGTTTEYEGSTYTINFSQSLKAAWYPMAVNDHEYSSALTDILGLSLNASLTVDVLSSEMIVLDFDTLEAFKVQYQFHLWGNSLNVTDTFIWWIVPYLGVVKEQRADRIGILTSFALAGGNMTYPGDADGDNISDYYEFSIYNTHWLLEDTDHDGLKDGFEVDYWGTGWNEDPDGDLLINLLDSDSDNDGLSDGVEILLVGTDPALADTDGNGLSDGEEVQCGSNPLDSNSKCFKGLPWLMLLLD